MRRTAAAVLVGMLLVACGSSDVNRAGSVETQVTFDEPLRVGPVTWTITVTNHTARDFALTFPTGQRADVTLSRNGKTLYRWSRAQMFTQVVGHVRIGTGDHTDFVLDEPGLDMDPGAYTLTATVVASNRRDLRAVREVNVRHM